MAEPISLSKLAQEYQQYYFLDEIAYFSSQDLNIDFTGCVTEVLNADTADYISKHLLQHLSHYMSFCLENNAQDDISSMQSLLETIRDKYADYIDPDVHTLYCDILSQGLKALAEQDPGYLHGLITYGACSGHFFMLNKLLYPAEDLYSLYVVDNTPPSMSPDHIRDFLSVNQNEGTSVAGPWSEILPEFQTLAAEIKLTNSTRESVNWLGLDADKCLSIWYSKDAYNGDELNMKVEQRLEDGLMGPGCDLLCDERYCTNGLSREDILSTIREICEEFSISIDENLLNHLADFIMANFGLDVPTLEKALEDAQTKIGVNATYKDRCLAEALEENELSSISMDLGREVVRQMGNGFLCEPAEFQFRALALNDHPEWSDMTTFDMAGVLFHDYCERLDMHEAHKEQTQDR